MKINELSTNLIAAVENHNIIQYNNYCEAIVAHISSNKFAITKISHYLTVGTALYMILDEMPKSGTIYKRVLLTAIYCLLNIICKNKDNVKQKEAAAILMLYILFTENLDFIGAEYLASNLKDIEAAVYHSVGMMNVLLWKYKSAFEHPTFHIRTQQRYQIALETANVNAAEIDTASRHLIIDGAYFDFKTIVKCIPLDFEMKYPGVSPGKLEKIYPEIQDMFKSNSKYFQTVNPELNPELIQDEQKTQESNNLTNQYTSYNRPR